MPNNPTMFIEDFTPGETMEYDCGIITETAIIEFANQFDPQYFHTDPIAAKQSMYGGLIASGWHTASIMMRALVETYVAKSAGLGSPGVDELRWHLPVRPDDHLMVRILIKSTRKSKSKPQMGVLTTYVEVFNQNQERVMSLNGTGFFKSRIC